MWCAKRIFLNNLCEFTRYKRQNMSSRRNQFFPYLYASCPPQRRGTLPYDRAQHDRSRHRISGPEPFHGNIQGATFHAFSLLPPPTGISASASSSPLSVVTAWELNTFVQTELEPNTFYNQSCNAVVDRLCQFMQNSFPKMLRPSEVLKVTFVRNYSNWLKLIWLDLRNFPPEPSLLVRINVRGSGGSTFFNNLRRSHKPTNVLLLNHFKYRNNFGTLCP